jgi:hypothetical protein
MTRTSIAILAVIHLAAALAAQPSAGDYVVVQTANVTNPTLLSVNRSGVASTLAVAPANFLLMEPRMDVGNRDLVATFIDRKTLAGSLVRITPGSQVATLATAASVAFPRAIEVDADGSYLLFGLPNLIMRATRGRFISIGSVPPPFSAFAMTVDPTTGDYLMADFGGRIARMDHRTQVVTTLLPGGFRYVTGMDHDEATDTFAFCNETLQSIFYADRQFRIVSSFGTPAQNWSLRLAPDTGNVHVLDGASMVTEWTRQGAVVRTTRLPVQVDLFALEVYGSRPISGVGSAARGTTYRLEFGFPGAAGLNYAAALSLGGIQPAIGLPDGRRIALALDPLFVLTATLGDIPGLTRGLRGTLSATGQATATVAVPKGLPAGLRVFASAVVLDPRAPLGLRTGNTWSFEVN